MDAKKTEVIREFNKNHQPALYDLLAYLGDVKLDLSDPATSAQLVDFNSNSLEIKYSTGNSQIPTQNVTLVLKMPVGGSMASAAQLRLLSFEAADALKVSPYQITEFKIPSPADVLVALSYVLVIGAALSPGVLRKYLEKRSTYVAEVAPKILNTIAVVSTGLHIWQYYSIMRPLLSKYRVYGTARVYYQWAAALEGVSAWKRLDSYGKKLDKKRGEEEIKLKAEIKSMPGL